MLLLPTMDTSPIPRADEFRGDFLCLERLDECWKCLRHTSHCNGFSESDDGGACGTEEKRSGQGYFLLQW